MRLCYLSNEVKLLGVLAGAIAARPEIQNGAPAVGILASILETVFDLLEASMELLWRRNF